MSDLSIFVSCGQFTAEERKLGKAIVRMVDGIPGMKAYFAEEVQDLNGLQANILDKLQSCDGFITVMHPRGDIERPDRSVHTRASVWIEQEIAIATYIRQVEKRDLPVIAFKHRSVGLEGIRSLIQLNPTEFTDDMEVLAALPGRLAAWKALTPSGIHPEVTSSRVLRSESGHQIRQLVTTIANGSGRRIREYVGEIKIPASILTHFSWTYALEKQATDDRHRVFRFDESQFKEIQPRSMTPTFTTEYCNQCGIADTGEPDQFIGGLVLYERVVEFTVWIEGREYQTKKSMKQLLMDAASET